MPPAARSKEHPMAGLGYRREMFSWDTQKIEADFFEVVPENWIRRDRAPLHKLIESGRPVCLHGVSLNLGGTSLIRAGFLRDIRELMDELGSHCYSDHLAASGDAHQLHDLFPVPFTLDEAIRVADRIKEVQDILGRRIAVENATWYTNVGDMSEPDFLSEVVSRSDCSILLDINNIAVNYKNHGLVPVGEYLAGIDLGRVVYMHVAGHEFDERFGLYVDTHSQPVEASTREVAMRLSGKLHVPVLLEWDNDVPDMDAINRELTCLRSMTM